MTLGLRILPRAERDAQVIFDYIAERSPNGAIRWWRAFESAAEKLIDNPNRYGFAAENGLLDYELRQFLFKTLRGRTYRCVFVLVDNEVRVLRVRGPGQPDLESDELPIE
jgi:plasmid stabilization system protein ParE